MSRATIDDVAALAGVSIKTVSRVVNEEPNVRPLTKERVMKAIAHLNYRPNTSARSLAGSRSYIVALLYDNPSANYVINVQDGAIKTCRQAGYDLLIHPCDCRDPNLANEISTLIVQSRIDGLLLTPPLSDMEPVVQALLARGTPFVGIAPVGHLKGAPYVATNDYEAAFEMTRYLIGLGHKDIGFISGHPDHCSVVRRLAGYKEALASCGIQSRDSLVMQGYNSFASGEAGARELFQHGNGRPTAVFASNDDMAAGVIKVAHEMALNIPGDLSVAGFDDTPVALQIWPSLTTVRQPIKSMAEKAAQLLLENLRGKSPAGREIIMDSTLVIRDSTGPCAPQRGGN